MTEEPATNTHLIALRTSSWKMVVNLAGSAAGRLEVYDLVADPREQSPLTPDRFPLPEHELKRIYTQTLRELQERARRIPMPDERDTPAISEMTEAQLRSLGYLK